MRQGTRDSDSAARHGRDRGGVLAYNPLVVQDFHHLSIHMRKILFWSALAGAMSMSTAQAQSPDLGATKSGGKAAMCIGCHSIPGYKVAFPHVYHVPFISGQNPKYLEAALKAYQSGERKHPTMRSIAASLTDKDITELAAYYGGMEKGVTK